MFNIFPLMISLLLTLGIATITSPLAYAIENNKNKLPDIGISGYSILSIDKELQIGQAMMRQLRGSQPLINDPVLNEYINHLGNSLVKNAQGVNYSFEFFLINNKELNAFAFFGGHVGIHSGLVTTADTESELAAVIAHEISHVTQRHLARRLESQSQSQGLTMAAVLSSVLISLVNPTVGMAALSASMALSQQASINYTRGNEKEADNVGISLLANSGYDPQAAASFFGKMSEKYRYASKPPAMLLTHPLPDSRITEARQRALNYPARPLPPSLDFELTKARLQARYEGDKQSNINYFKGLLAKKRYTSKEAAMYGLALSYFENKQHVEALELLETLLKKDKNNLFYVDAITDVYIANKQIPDALAMLKQLNMFMPNNQVVSLNYANALLSAKEYDQAIQILKDYISINQDNYIAYDILTTIYREKKELGLMHMYKAEIYALLGGYSKAVEELQTSYPLLDTRPLMQKRIKARILQLQEDEKRLQRL
ncbi:M48 family metallopeptidase [Colwellia echini]|uniref:Putative beta-barrel assembly-enhancing protease n=2 Tax=Colwellia echini TaxID=1982103 RepID=A0ABY3MYT4_9GAMM|nr:M48 family metallopeptidase [Colwellia echini]